MELDKSPDVSVKAYNKKQLAKLYRIDLKTFNCWISKHIDAIGHPVGYIYNPNQVRKIFEIFGLPD